MFLLFSLLAHAADPTPATGACVQPGDDSNSVEIDFTGSDECKPKSLRPALPNRSIVVSVTVGSGDAVKVESTGTPGSYTPEVDKSTKDGVETEGVRPTSVSPPPTVTRHFTLPPMQPGDVPITVTRSFQNATPWATNETKATIDTWRASATRDCKADGTTPETCNLSTQATALLGKLGLPALSDSTELATLVTTFKDATTSDEETAKKMAAECNRLATATGWTNTETATVTLSVTKQYSAAIRLGVAGTVGAPGSSYSVVTNDAGETVVGESSTGLLAGDVVLSYTQFFAPVAEQGESVHFGALVGVRLASISETPSIDFRSFYLGVDIGLRGFSVAPAFQLEAVDVLDGGLQPGDAFEAGADIPTVVNWRPRGAVIVSFPLGDLMGAVPTGS